MHDSYYRVIKYYGYIGKAPNKTGKRKDDGIGGETTANMGKVTSVTMPVITGETGGFSSFLGTFSVTFLRLNTMIIQPKYNSPFSDVVSSNAPPLHSDGSHPIRGFLFGE